MANPILTDVFLESISALADRSLPQRVAHCARMCLVDYIACYFAGRKAAGAKLEKLEIAAGHSAPMSALAYGISSHFVELDDGHRYGMLHLGAPVISALMAAAERHDMSSSDFLRGMVVGYETAIRLAKAVQPGCKLKGYHATGTCGTVGAAMAVAYAMHFDAEQIKSAFSAAATSAAGLLEMIEGDTELKPYNAGRAAMDGIMAAFAGRAKFAPPIDALGGRRGFLAVMTDSPKLDCLRGDGGTYGIETVYRKPYAACRHCHAPIEAALNIAVNPDFDVAKVKRITVMTYRLAVAGHEHVIAESSNSAKMSIPYSVAAALVRRSGGMEVFEEEALSDGILRDLAKKVSVVESEEFTALCPAKRIASVTVESVDGHSLCSQVDYPRGEPENPISDGELESKLRSLAAFGGVGKCRIDKLLSELSKAEFEVRNVISLLKPAAKYA